MPIKGQGWSEPCNNCVGRSWGDKLAVPEGSGFLGVALCGEALGDHEERDQLPFRPQAPAGSLLDRAIRMAGFTRSQFTIYNTVNCRPPGNKLDGERYESSAVESCRAYNDRLIASRKPRVIVALGGVATRALTDFDGSDKKRTHTAVRGWVVPSRCYLADGRTMTWGREGQPMWVIPTLHPSFIQRGAKEFLPVLIHDLRLAVHVARTGVSAPQPTSYQLTPCLDDALAFAERVRREQGALLSFDIETPWSKEHTEDDDPEAEGEGITTIQFSLGAGEGITLPWTGRFVEIARDLLALPNPKLGCNSWQFDEPRLALQRISLGGLHHDLRWAFHCLYPDLPTNLQFIASFLSTQMRLLTKDGYDPVATAEQPWKHTAQVVGSDYGCRDVDMPLRVWPLLVDELRRVGAWRSYEAHTLGVRPALARASGYGIPVNLERHAAFEAQLATDLAAKLTAIQPLVPDDIKRLEPPGGYKNPKLADKRMALPNQGLDEGEHWVTRWFKVRSGGGDYDRASGELSPSVGPEYVEVERWARQQDFKPDSPQQVITIIKRLGDKVPRFDDGSGDTTGKTALDRLARQTKRPVYRLILEARALAEMKGTHVEGWRPSCHDEQDRTGGTGDSVGVERAEVPSQCAGSRGDCKGVQRHGRVHPRFTFTPATGQLACYGSPNALNPPKPKGHAEKDALAVSFRRMIQARPGYRLWEFDLKSAHALTLGFEARDPTYMRLARLDCHSYLAAHMEGEHDPALKAEAEQCLGWPDDQLGAFLAGIKKKYKSTRDDRAKPSLLGIGFGLGYRKLYMMNRESFASETAAKRVRDLLRALFPRVFAWQDEIRAIAHYDPHFLRSRHGAIRWFFDVYHANRYTGELEPGEDSEAAIAFLPANDAFGYLKDVMLYLDGEDAQLVEAGMMIPLHDALVFEMPRALESHWVPLIYQTMIQPSPRLVDPEVAPGGLSIGASVSRGDDWSAMEDVVL